MVLGLYNIGKLIASVQSPQSEILSTSATPYSELQSYMYCNICIGLGGELSYTIGKSELTSHVAGKSERNLRFRYSAFEH